MSHEAFRPTEEWPLQESYKRFLHERIQQWGERVAPVLDKATGEERTTKIALFEWLMTSVERQDRLTAELVDSLDGYAREYCEGPGMYGRGGGMVNSPAGEAICRNQFQGLYGVFQAGAAGVTQA